MDKRLKKAEKKVLRLLSKLYSKGYLIRLGFTNGSYSFSFWSDHLHKPQSKE